MKQTLLKILTKNRNNKLYILLKTIFSALFAISIVLDKMITFDNSIYGTIKDTYFNQFESKYVLIFIVVFFICYIILSLIELLIDYTEGKIVKKNKQRKKYSGIKIFIISFIFILLCWLPYILSFFPGGVYADTVDSIGQAIEKTPLNNKNPILYALLLKIFFISGDTQFGLELFTMFQALIMAGVCSYFAYWLYKKDINLFYVILTVIYFGLFNLIPLYAISIWKDTPFSIALFAYSIFIAEIVCCKAKNMEKPKNILIYVILGALVSFARNNGFYVFIATTVILLIAYRKMIAKGLKKFAIIAIAEIIAIIIIQGPIYNKLNLSHNEIVESIGPLIQQVAYVVATDGTINEEQYTFINDICAIETLKITYNPCLVDTIKNNPNCNMNFIENNKKQFIEVWFQLLQKNQESYVKAYLLNSLGYWDVNKAILSGYISPTMWNGVQYEQHDYIEKITNKSIKEKLQNVRPISSAIFLNITLLGALMCIYKKRYNNILILLPAIFTWLTIMIATPLAFSLRYVYILVLIIPLAIISPFLMNKNRGK